MLQMGNGAATVQELTMQRAIAWHDRWVKSDPDKLPPPIKLTDKMEHLWHPSLELGQHSGGDIEDVLQYAVDKGCVSVQPSANMFWDADWNLKYTADEVRRLLEKYPLRADMAEKYEWAGYTHLMIDGISFHCPQWVHDSVHTGSKMIRPFLPSNRWSYTAADNRTWIASKLKATYDLAYDLGLRVNPTFYGLCGGFELAAGYLWTQFQWDGEGEAGTGAYDLLEESADNFRTWNLPMLDHLWARGMLSTHETHYNTLASSAVALNYYIDAVEGHPALCGNADKSHCDEQENYLQRLCGLFPTPFGWTRWVDNHFKNFWISQGVPLFAPQQDWLRRGKYFSRLAFGNLNMVDVAYKLQACGQPQMWLAMHTHTPFLTCPAKAEAEDPALKLSWVSGDGVAFVNENICLPLAAEPFDKNMGQTSASSSVATAT